MSGHSHWAGIKYKKGLADAKRSQAFSKMAKEIMVAVREGGSDLNFNAKLKLTIEKAKAANMPADNIERAIKRGSGETETAKLEEVLFEAYGPGGIAVIIEGITDNKNRTLGEIKQILNQNDGKLTGEGSVKWMFERKGCITINPEFQSSDLKKEELEMLAIEAEAEDVYWHDGILDIYVKAEELEKTKRNLEEKGVKIESASLDWVAKEEVSPDEKTKKACQKLFEVLDENEAIQEIYSNLKI